VYGDLLGKPERKRPIGNPGYRCDNNIEVNVKQVRWESIE
jgi:hypothetical protein